MLRACGVAGQTPPKGPEESHEKQRLAAMKKDIHPQYVECTVTCGCGHSFKTRSTKPELRVEICSNCHPFFTGQQKYVDTAGRVERFTKKFGGEYFKKSANKETVKKA